MNINKLTKRYQVKILNETNIEEIAKLYGSNPKYFEYVPPLFTKESIKEDLHALPPKKTNDDKYFIGYYSDHLVAVLDLILSYPNDTTAFIGLFMVNAKDQGKYIGWNMIQDLGLYLKEIGYQEIRLGYVEKNEPAKYFWEKCGFEHTGLVSHEENYDVIVLKKEL